MSIWLSAAHRVANTGRGRGMVMAAAKRQQASANAATAKAVIEFWTRVLQGQAGALKGR